MVWFECTDCGDSLKKPKIQSHTYSCSASAFNCIDCGRTFDRHSVKEHIACVTEHDKYAKGATKPGGYAAQGFYGNGEQTKAEAPGAPAGLEFLATRAPWKCSICNVTCTSSETLMGHAAGAKHKRRARAATKDQVAGEDGNSREQQAPTALPAEEAPAPKDQAPSAQSTGRDTNGKGAGKKRKHAESSQSLPSTSKQPKQDVSEQAGTSGVGEDAATGHSNGAAAAAEGGGKEKGFKWKKLAEKVLQAKGGSRKIKVQKLQEKVLAAAGLSADLIGVHGDAMLQRWQKSSRRFSVLDGYVCLKQQA